MTINITSALFYSRKDILKNKLIFIFITLSIIFATANIIVINSLTDGMIKDLVDNAIESSSGHLNIYPADDERFIDGLGVKEQKLAALNGVEAYSPRLSTSGILSKNELSASAAILSLDPVKEMKTTRLLEKITEGQIIESNDNNAILVSYRLAEDLKLKVGDSAELSFDNGKVKVYDIKGIIRTGAADFDSSTVIIPIKEANQQLGLANSASVILIRLSDKELADQYLPVITESLRVTSVKTWKKETEYLLSFAGAWQGFSSIISAVGLVAAAISVGIIIYINVIHKTRQIGIMKAIGAKDDFIFVVFLMEAVLFGIIGISIGDSLGYFAVKYFEEHPLYDAVMQTWIGARFEYALFLKATAVSFVVTILSGVYPAIKASRVDIIKAIWGK